MSEFLRRTCFDFHEAYSAGDTDPVAVARRTLEAIRRSERRDPPLGAFATFDEDRVLRQAEESADRFEQGASRGPLDGVPIAIKDEFDVEGYPTTAGTSFRGKTAAREDATVVARLRRAGAVILGKTVMTEIGLGGTGINPNQKTPRNPHDPGRMTGGSSSGSAAAVAAGLCPSALGSDAGGSIRMPAALCGVYGFKPGYGRVPSTGAALLAWTLDHIGPLAGSMKDLMAFYEATAGADQQDEISLQGPDPRPVLGQPPVDLTGVRFAWCPDFADDADEGVRKVFHDALDRLRDAGANVREVELSRAEHIQRVGYITIASEAAASQREWLEDHRDEYNLDTRLLLAVAERFTAVEYLHAQRVRSEIRREFRRILSNNDVFLNPTLACTAPPLTESAMRTTEVNSVINSALTRYTFAGTLTGMPGLSIPCGRDENDLPVGLHLMSSMWSDEKLLRIGAAVDQYMPPLESPRVYFDTLSE